MKIAVCLVPLRKSAQFVSEKFLQQRRYLCPTSRSGERAARVADFGRRALIQTIPGGGL